MTEYYQAMPARLRVFFVAVPIYLAFCALMVWLFGNVPLMLFLVVVCGGAVTALLLYNVFVLIGLRRPLITLSDSCLTYRTLKIPWELISDVTTIRTPMGDRVGVTLVSNVIRTKSTRPDKVTLPGVGYLVRKSIEKYGAIIIPPVKGLTTEGMRQILWSCHARAREAASR